MSDAVNPSHYKVHPSGVECIDIVEHLGFNLGNAIKYLWRAGLKENAPTTQDIAKAHWYLTRAANSYLHWPSTIEPALDRVMATDSLLTRVLAALVGVPGHHRGTTAKDVQRAIEILDAEIDKGAS